MRYFQKIIRADVDIVTHSFNLVWARHLFIKLFSGNRDQARVGNPGTIVSVGHFTGFIVPDFLQGCPVPVRIILYGNLGGHPPDGMGPPAMAGLNRQQRIGVHAVSCHGNLGPVGKEVSGNIFKPLDETEYIIPASAVQTRYMIFQHIEDFIHLKRRQDRLYKDSGFDCAHRDSQCFLRQYEYIIPQGGFQVTFHFRKVKIGAAAPAKKVFGIVKKEKTEVEQAARDRAPVNQNMLFTQVPAARTNNQGGGLIIETVSFPLGIRKFNGPINGIPQVDLPFDGVFPGWRVAVFKICHIGGGPGIKSVDDHLPVHRPCNFHPPVQKILRHRRDTPAAIADGLCFRKETGELPLVDFSLNCLAAVKQFLPPFFKAS